MGVKFKDNSNAAISALNKDAKKALEACGLTAEGHAKRTTPVDTGRLRNSIAHKVSGDSVYIGTNVEYGPYIELGARGRKAHHMLENAVSGHASEYKKIVEQALKNS